MGVTSLVVLDRMIWRLRAGMVGAQQRFADIKGILDRQALSIAEIGIVTTRGALVPLPDLAVGSVDAPVSWATPMPALSYVVLPLITGTGVDLWRVTPVVKSRSLGGCVVTLTNSGLAPIIAGQGSLAAIAISLDPSVITH